MPITILPASMMAFTLPPTPVICTSKLEGTASYHEGFHAFAYPCYLNKQASAILPITMKAFTILPAPIISTSKRAKLLIHTT